MRSSLIRSWLLLPLALATACSDSPTDAPAPVDRVEMDQSIVELELRDSVRLVATPATASGAVAQGVTVTWTSSSAGVARVDADGLVTGLSEGSAVVTASVDGVSARTTVTVLGWNVADNVAVIDSTALDLLSDETERAAGTYRFRVLQAPPPNIEVGDVIVGAQDLGFLRRVSSVSTVGDVVTLQTGAAALSEVIEEGSFDTSVDLIFAPGAPNLVAPVGSGQVRWGEAKMVLAEGVALNAAGISLSGLDICKVLKDTGGSLTCPTEIKTFQVKTGVLDFSPRLDVSAGFSGLALATFRGVLDGHVQADFELLLEAAGSVSPIKPQIDIAEITRPFYAQIGPVPVIGYVELGLKAGLEAKATAKGSIQAGFTNSHTVSVGAEWEASAGWTPVFENQRTFDAKLPSLQEGTLNGQIDVETKLFLKPEFKIIFYGVVGPFANVEPFGKFTLTFGTSACGMRSEAGINSEIGFTIPFLDPKVGNFSQKNSPWFSWPGRDWDCPLGFVDVATVTNGSSPDTDGYGVLVDGVSKGTVGSNGQTVLEFVEVGKRSVEIDGVASNCTVQGANPRDVTVNTGLATPIAFTITCADPGGDLEVELRTTGADPDPDGYTLIVDGSQSKSVGVNQTVTFAGLSMGDHQLLLRDFEPNCVPLGPNPRTVTVPARGLVRVTVEVQCEASQLTVRTVTTGVPASTSWSVWVDGTERGPISPSGQATFDLSAGVHQVELRDVAANCTVQGGNPRSVTLSSSTLTETFNVACAVGGITVTVQTSGDASPATTYTAEVAGQSASVAINGSVSFANLPEGSHEVRLAGLPPQCLVQGQNPRPVQAPGAVTFDVVCQAPVVCDVSPNAASLDQFIDASFGPTTVDRNEYGWVEVSVSATAPPAAKSSLSEASSSWVDWIKVLPLDPSRVGESVELSWSQTRSLTVTRGSNTDRPWAYAGSAGDADKIGFGGRDVTTATATVTVTRRILLGQFWEYFPGEASAAVSVDDGSTSSATARLQFIKFLGVKDLAGNDVPIARICSASGTNYAR